jgi:hypothetical protein
MHTDPEVQGAFWRDTRIEICQSLLDLDGTLDSIDSTWELSQDAVACRISNPPAMLRNEPVHDLTMGCESAQGPDLVLLHKARVSGHISSEDRGQPPFDPLRWFRHTAEHSFRSVA